MRGVTRTAQPASRAARRHGPAATGAKLRPTSSELSLPAKERPEARQCQQECKASYGARGQCRSCDATRSAWNRTEGSNAAKGAVCRWAVGCAQFHTRSVGQRASASGGRSSMKGVCEVVHAEGVAATRKEHVATHAPAGSERVLHNEEATGVSNEEHPLHDDLTVGQSRSGVPAPDQPATPSSS
jgi:hypothetical protein